MYIEPRSDSATWYGILTDYGLVGFIRVFFRYFLPPFWLWWRRQLEVPVVVFFVLYFMSFYQRVVIRLPAQMLIYFAGIYWVAITRKLDDPAGQL